MPIGVSWRAAHTHPKNIQVLPPPPPPPGERSLERCFLVSYGPYFKLRSLAFLVVVICLCFCASDLPTGDSQGDSTYEGATRRQLGGALGQGDWYQSNNERIENMAASMLSQSKLFCALPTSRLALSMLTLL